MKKLYVAIIYLFINVLFFSNIKAQSTANAYLLGKVTDDSGKIIPNVSITLSTIKDSTSKFYKGTITDKEGKFIFSFIDAQDYVLVINHLEFLEQEIKITIKQDETKELNTIALLPQVKGLQGVTVVTRKSLIEQNNDKIIFNVENDPLAKTETAKDLLRKTPFVTVDGEGNIQVNGQSNFKVLLDGRETAMFAQNVKEALKGFPGAVITKIEVITSPSAKYDAEGVGGIINIVTKKKTAGFNGSATISYESTGDVGGSTTLNAKFNKIGASLFYSAFSRNNLKEGFYTRTDALKDAIYDQRNLDGYRWIDMYRNTGNAEINYQIDSLNVLSVYGSVSGGFFKTLSEQLLTTKYSNSNIETGLYQLNNNQQFPGVTIGSDYVKKFSKNEKELSIRVNGDFSKNNTFLNSNLYQITNNRFIINKSFANNKEFTFQSDFIQPVNKNQKLEVGIKMIRRQAQSDFESLIKYDESKAYQLNAFNTDYFTYKQNVYSTYGTYSFKIRNSTFRVGARIERTETKGDFITSDKKVSQNYTSLLPNIQATTKLGKNTLVINYNERLQRPYINSLNPFVNNNDSLNIFYGNPDLQPQKLRNLSIQQRLPIGKNFIGITLSGSYSNDMIVQYSIFDQATGITQTTSGNIGRELQTSLALNFTTSINSNWNLFFNGAIRYNNIKNRSIKDEAFEGFTGNGNMNTTYKINKKLSATAFFNFRLPQVTYQVTSNTHLWYGTGISYLLFNNKLSANLQASGFLQKSFDYRFITENDDFKITNGFINPYRRVKLGLTWNFGKLKENVSKKKGIINDDLIN